MSLTTTYKEESCERKGKQATMSLSKSTPDLKAEAASGRRTINKEATISDAVAILLPTFEDMAPLSVPLMLWMPR